jgi:hypothetical protein
MTKRESNIFDKIGNLIPGYKGYAVRDEKRKDDKNLRNAIASKVEQAEIEIVKHQQSLIRNNQIQICQEWEIVRKSLDTFKIKINKASYGESSFFSNEQIKENELDQIYGLDLELAERVNLISKTIDSEINEALSPILVNQQLCEINTLLVKRNDFINKF